MERLSAVLNLFVAVSFIVFVLALPLSKSWKDTMIWVIQYTALPPCWIREHGDNTVVLDVTFQRKFAKTFTSCEDARHEMLRLGLTTTSWLAVNVE